jgi:mono/diheme cytochrome c family protein
MKSPVAFIFAVPLLFGSALLAGPAALARERIEGFTAYGGQWAVRGVELWAARGDGPKLVCNGPALREGEVGVEVFLPGKQKGNAGLVLKLSEPGVGADHFIGYEVALDGAGHLVLGRHRHNFEPIRNVPCRVPADQWIALVVKMTERGLEVLVDGTSMLRYEDHDHPLLSGQVALRTWQRDARYRNLWIRSGGQRKNLPFEAVPDPDAAAKASAAERLGRVNLPTIAFITRYPLGSPNSVANDIWQSQPRRLGCSIRIFDSARPGTPAKVLFNDPEGCIYDMNMSYDARTLLFSYKRKGEKHWHIWRIQTDGSGLRQLTDGPYYDISPCLLPDGDIMFVSTRRFGHTVCQPGPASNLHRMAPDGSNIRCVSMNTLADFSPQVLPDGRVLFTRWEYVDRDLTFRQSLWTQNPDGTGYQLYFGNTVREVGTFWQARPLPGQSDRVVCTFAPHHGFPHGAIGLVDTRSGPEAPRGVGYTWITREFLEIGDRAHEWSYRDPFPLSDTFFLCSYGGGGQNRFRIYLLDAWDNQRLLYEDPEMSCFFPLALRPVPVPPRIVTKVRPDVEYGTCVLTDVYRGLTGIERGRVKSLRIMEQVRKTEDLVSRAFDESPVMSYGTYYAKRCWGTVPVLEDGSAHFQVPALREVYFQVLDAEGRELQRMTSGAQVMPGETVSCIGCHENRREAPPRSQQPQAARRPAFRPEKPEFAKDGIIDFPTVVQPVLDKYCVKCHTGPNPDGGVLLCGDKTRLFNMAYDNLLGRSQSYRQHNMETGEMLPSEAAKGKPLVHFFWLLRTPTAVNQPLWAGTHASRLPDYYEAKHCGQEVLPKDRQRIYLWIDANVPYYGTYAHSRPKSPGRRDLCTDVATGLDSAWYAREYLGVYNRRCASCHGPVPHPNENTKVWDGRLAWIDFTHPEWSPALTAHLVKPLGRGIDKPQAGKVPPMFTSTRDPDYQAMLRAIEKGKASMLADPEADMPGFKGARPEP